MGRKVIRDESPPTASDPEIGAASSPQQEAGVAEPCHPLGGRERERAYIEGLASTTVADCRRKEVTRVKGWLVSSETVSADPIIST